MHCTGCPARHLKEACGIAAIYGPPETSPAWLRHYLLPPLQHRGEESAGCAVCQDGEITRLRGLGWIKQALPEDQFSGLCGEMAIGHTRYSTSGNRPRVEDAQPLSNTGRHGTTAIAHNGNLVNAVEHRGILTEAGASFESRVDSEVVLQLINLSDKPFEEALKEALVIVKGSFSLVILNSQNGLYCVRDPFGVCPLVIGWTAGMKQIVVASESCAFNVLPEPLEDWREVEPGELVHIYNGGFESEFIFPPEPQRQCVFQLIYFARPDSVVFGRSVEGFRNECGIRLGETLTGIWQQGVVAPIPNSGLPFGYGLGQGLGRPIRALIGRNQYYGGRAFMQPGASDRPKMASGKIFAVPEGIRGSNVILADDSIVRGSTISKDVARVRGYRPKAVLVAVGSPPVIAPCYWGIDFSTREELIATRHATDTYEGMIEGVRGEVGADALAYLTPDILRTAAGDPKGEKFCYHCFTGDPAGLPLPQDMAAYATSVTKAL